MSTRESRVQKVREKYKSILEFIISLNYYTASVFEEDPYLIFIRNPYTNSLPDNPYMSLVDLSQQEKEELVNIATSMYIETWLDVSKNTKKRIADFTKEVENPDIDPDDFRRRMKYEREKFEIMMKFREDQLHMEGFEEKEIVKKCKDVNKKKGEYHFSTIKNLEWVNNTTSSFLDLMMFKKGFERGSNTTHANNNLKSTYCAYFKGISELKTTEDPKKYVATVCMLRKSESAFLYIVAACLALSIRGNPNINMDDAIHKTAPWYARYEYYSQHLAIHRRECVFFNDMLSYPQIMRAAAETDMEKLRNDRDKCTIKRGILQDMMSWFTHDELMHFLHSKLQGIGLAFVPFDRFSNMQQEQINQYISLYQEIIENPKELDRYLSGIYPEWEDSDYQDAAEFFKKQYQVIEKHISFSLPRPDKWSKTVFENIRIFFEPLLQEDVGALRKHYAARDKKNKNSPSQNTEPTLPNKRAYETSRLSERKKQAKKREINQLRTQGKSVREISIETDIPKSTVYRWLKNK